MDTYKHRPKVQWELWGMPSYSHLKKKPQKCIIYKSEKDGCFCLFLERLLGAVPSLDLIDVFFILNLVKLRKYLVNAILKVKDMPFLQLPHSISRKELADFGFH